MSIIPRNEAAEASAKYKNDVDRATTTVAEQYVLKYTTRGLDSAIAAAESTELGNKVSSVYGAARKYADVPKTVRTTMRNEDVKCAREILRILLLTAKENVQVVRNALAALKAFLESLLVALDAQRAIYDIQVKAIEIANYENELKRIVLVKGIDVAQNATSRIPYVDQLRSAPCVDVSTMFSFVDESIQMPVRIAKGLLFEINQKYTLTAEIYAAIDKIDYIKGFLKGFIADIEYTLAL